MTGILLVVSSQLSSNDNRSGCLLALKIYTKAWKKMLMFWSKVKLHSVHIVKLATVSKELVKPCLKTYCHLQQIGRFVGIPNIHMLVMELKSVPRWCWWYQASGNELYLKHRHMVVDNECQHMVIAMVTKKFGRPFTTLSPQGSHYISFTRELIFYTLSYFWRFTMSGHAPDYTPVYQ